MTPESILSDRSGDARRYGDLHDARCVQSVSAGGDAGDFADQSVDAAGGNVGNFCDHRDEYEFRAGTTQLSPIPGVTIGAITVTSATSMTVQLTAASNAVPQPYSILAITGSEQDVLPNGLVIQ
jgi:hypothetical protein